MFLILTIEDLLIAYSELRLVYPRTLDYFTNFNLPFNKHKGTESKLGLGAVCFRINCFTIAEISDLMVGLFCDFLQPLLLLS